MNPTGCDCWIYHLHQDFGFLDEILLRHCSFTDGLYGHFGLVQQVAKVDHPKLATANLLHSGELRGINDQFSCWLQGRKSKDWAIEGQTKSFCGLNTEAGLQEAETFWLSLKLPVWPSIAHLTSPCCRSCLRVGTTTSPFSPLRLAYPVLQGGLFLPVQYPAQHGARVSLKSPRITIKMIPAKFHWQQYSNEDIFQEGLSFHQIILRSHFHPLCSAFILVFNIDSTVTPGLSSPPSSTTSSVIYQRPWQRQQSGEQCTGKAWRNPLIVAVTTQIFLNIHGDHPVNQPGVWLIPWESWESLTIAEPCGDGGLFPPGGDRVSQPRHETWGQGTRSCYCHSHGGPACHHPTGQLGFWKQIYCTEFSAPLEGSWTSVQALVSCLWEGSQFWARSAYFPFWHPELWVSVNSDEFPNVFMGYFPWYSWTVGMEVTMSGYGYWPCPWLCVKPRPRDRSPQEDPAV